MTYQDIADRCVPLLPGVFIPSVVDATKQAAIDLCRESDVMLRTVTISLLEGDTGASIVIPDAKSLRVLAFGDETGGYAFQSAKDYVAFAEPLEADQSFDVVCACQPDSSVLPDDLARYDEAIFNRAMYLMLKIPKQEWTDRAEAEEYKRLWMGDIHDAKQSADVGHQTGTRRQFIRRFV